MKNVKDRIIVKVNMAQKNEIIVGGVKVRTALKYENNHREKSPVIAEVIEGNRWVKTGKESLRELNYMALFKLWHHLAMAIVSKKTSQQTDNQHLMLSLHPQLRQIQLSFKKLHKKSPR